MVVPPALMTFEIMTIVKGSGAQDKRAVFCSGGHVTTGTHSILNSSFGRFTCLCWGLHNVGPF